MAHDEVQLVAFNRGLISPLAIARVDLKRAAMSAATMVNWQPRSLGPMMLRPGTGYLAPTNGSLAARFLPFVFRINDTALLEFTNAAMRVWISDALVTRTAVSTAVTNGSFTANVNNWTDNDTGGATSLWVTDGAGGGYLQLTGNATSGNAIRDQQVNVAAQDQNVEHGLRIVIARGPVKLLVGSALAGGQYMDVTLGAGTHSLAFTPTGATFWIRFQSGLLRKVWVDSCNIEAAGTMSVTSPYLTADLGLIRGGEQSQSADVIFVACSGYQQRRIERHETRGWSIVLYQPEDGPFRTENTSITTLGVSATFGNITVTASANIFKSTMVGGLFQITSNGQRRTGSVTAENEFIASIRVVGVGATRTIAIVVGGVFVATAQLQRSFDSSEGPWADVAGQSWVAPVTTTYADGLDNQIVWYRIGVKTGAYTSGQVDFILSISSGSITGVVRVTDFTSTTVVGAEVLVELGGTTAVDTWAEGLWSDYRGWPTAVGFYEGRLAWAGQNGIVLSTTDGFDVYLTDLDDGTPVGDSGPISRSIGSGPVDIINWILPIQRLILGGQMKEFSCRSNSFDEPLTPSNFNVKPCSSQGSYAVQAAAIDARGVFVQRGGTRVFQLEFDATSGAYDYQSTDLTIFFPEAGGLPDSGTTIVRLAVQRQPDTRIHCIRSDGVAAVLINDTAEKVLCWVFHETDGTYEDVVVLPAIAGKREDQVYYVVNRTINGATVRYLEKWAYESECSGATLSKQADAFVTYTFSSPQMLITGLSHLEGEDVVVWADGADVGTDDTVTPPIQTYEIISGQIYSKSLGKFLVLSGAAGTYADTPDSAVLDVLGNIEFIAYIKPDDYTPAVENPIIAKMGAAQLSYYFCLLNSGKLRITTSADGAVSLSVGSTVVVPGVNGVGMWVRGTLEVDDGAGNRVYNFYYSDDGAETGPGSVNWTPLGDTVTSATASSIFAGTAALEIGSFVGGAVYFTGKIYRAQVYDGIEGALVGDFNLSNATIGAATVVSPTTGETYTMHGAAVITGTPGLLTPATNVVVGLPYDATFKGTKLGQALGHFKLIEHIAVFLKDTHPKGLRWGPTLTDAEMDYITQVQSGVELDADEILAEFDEPPMTFPGTWSTDARLCLKASAPRPCTLLAAVVTGEHT